MVSLLRVLFTVQPDLVSNMSIGIRCGQNHWITVVIETHQISFRITDRHTELIDPHDGDVAEIPRTGTFVLFVFVYFFTKLVKFDSSLKTSESFRSRVCRHTRTIRLRLSKYRSKLGAGYSVCVLRRDGDRTIEE